MTYTTHTTLAAIRASSPCKSGWTTLLAYLCKTAADDDQLPLLDVLDACGLDDCLWVIDHAVGDERLIRHLRAAFAERALHIYEAVHPGDNRIRHQIETLRNDDATPEQRDASQDGAQNARTAAWAAWAAGNADAALAADAARAARAVARAARAAAGAAYAADAAGAARAAERAAARAAARAARAAAQAAYAADAAGAADAARAALEARADERAEQEVILREILTEEPNQ